MYAFVHILTLFSYLMMRLLSTLTLFFSYSVLKFRLWQLLAFFAVFLLPWKPSLEKCLYFYRCPRYTGGPRYMQSFYLRFRVFATEKWLFSGTYPLIYSHPWSFYMRIRYMRAYFFGPYLTNITRDTCIWYFSLHI